MATDADPELEALIEYIKTNRGFDFSGYKRPSLERRFEKRMQVVGVKTPGEYRTYLEDHPDEFIDLFNTILINVTAFFRDAPTWDYLRQEIVPAIIASVPEDDAIRIWSTGCASGEEAYSLAIIFAEALEPPVFRDRVKIYATDVDEEALADGRHGTYPLSRLESVSPELRERYFDRHEQRYTAKPELRRAVIFGRHDVVQDPPISRIDLLCSRNTLMYFTAEAQARILANFHFALRDGGFLLLGKSEMMLARSSLFSPVDLKRRVFSKIARSDRFRPLPQPKTQPDGRGAPPDGMVGQAGFESSPIPQLVVDGTGTLVLANLQARTLFNVAPRDVGQPLKDLEVSYKPVELRSQIDRAREERHTVALRGIEWAQPGEEVKVLDVQIVPLALNGADGAVSISFLDVTRFKQLQDTIEHSKRDVETAYEELQSTVEELETTNEELQSTNEELETTNEELQSTNEELETMNEELQSTNEELETINDELNQRTDQLNQTNLFLESILRSVDAGVVVLDQELRVTAWNDGAHELWGLDANEVQGQHFMNLDIGLPVEQLHAALRSTVATGDAPAPVTIEAMNRRGRTILCRVSVSPLLGDNGTPRGVILFMEATDR